MLNIDALLSHIYEDLRSALRDNVSLQPLLDFLKYRSYTFLRQKRRRHYAISPSIKTTTMQYLYRDSAYPKAYAPIRGDARRAEG